MCGIARILRSRGHADDRRHAAKRGRTAALLIAVMAFASGASFGHEESPIALEVSGPEQACGLEGRQADEPLPILIAVAPESLTSPAYLGPLIACAPARHLEIIVRLDPPSDWAAAADPYHAVEGWLHDLDQALQAWRGAVRVFELGSRPDLRFEPRAYAFLVERVGTLIRSTDPEAILVLGALGDAPGAWLDDVDARRITPYIRGLALQDPVALGDWLPRLARDYPGMPVWLHLDPAQKDPATSLLRYSEVRASGVETVIQVMTQDTPGPVFLNLSRVLPARFVVEPQTPVLSFFDPLGPERAAVLIAASEVLVPASPEAVKNVRAFDLTTAGELAAQVVGDVSQPDHARVVVAATTSPVLVRYVIVREPRPPHEGVTVTEERELTAEEIVAGERAFAAGQARAMDHYETTATIAYHYRAETLGEAIDVATTNRFYWREGAGEYEETALYINGARWHGKPPSLPFIQAEKVREVPLEIRLDQSYLYRLLGKDALQGQPVYRISFEAIQSGASLYSGEVWIHQQTFARMKIRLVQHGLTAPITSNTDTIEYGPVTGRLPDGATEREFWLPIRCYRQMIFTVLGREVAAERTVKYEDFSINAPAFADRREAAYASGATILRDDEAGSSYLVREGGVMRQRDVKSLENVAFFGGASINGNGSLGTPFGGLNYFNFNWRNTGTQLDLAFAGPLVDLVWTDPSLGGSRWELTLDGRFVGVAEGFHGRNSPGAVEEEDVKILEERGLVVLAHPLSPFQKAVMQFEFDADKYRRETSTDPNFVLPASGLTAVGTAGWNYQRHGYKVDLWFAHGHRFSWNDWGILDPNFAVGTEFAHGSASDTDFDRWGATMLKSFYPGKLQNFSVGVSLFDGSHLDHFSRFQIGDFRNARVRGFSNKGLTFDRAALAQCNYKFTLAGGGASMELGLEGGVIENADDLLGREYLVGGGAAVSISGPWSTLLSFRASFGVASSLDVSIGAPSLRIVMIKTLDHWPHRHRKED